MAQQTKLVIEPQEVDERLAEFRFNRLGLVRVALSALAARNDSLSIDPKTAKGQFSYIYGVRTLRQMAIDADYEPVSRQNIESVYDATNMRKIMFQTVDCACLKFLQPKAISEIGSGKELVIESAQMSMFPDIEVEERLRRRKLTEYERAEAWYLCVAFVNGSVACELSRPSGVENKQFASFAERIFILGGGDLGPSGLLKLDDDTPPLEIKPQIIKR